MTIVENISREEALGPDAPARRDTITLGWEERQRTHGRRRSDGGVEFALSLEPGRTLRDGDCLILDAENVVVVVREAAEPVYVLRPRSEREWAFYAYQIGNRHQKLMISGQELVCLQDAAVRSLFEQLGVACAADRRPFNPVRVAGGHRHAHEAAS